MTAQKTNNALVVSGIKRDKSKWIELAYYGVEKSIDSKTRTTNQYKLHNLGQRSGSAPQK